MRPILASTIIAIPLFALLVYLAFFVTEVTAGEAGGLAVLILILASLLLLVFFAFPMAKAYSKSSLLLFLVIIFCVSTLLGISTIYFMFGTEAIIDKALLLNAAIMVAIPSLSLAALWWWLVKRPNQSLKRDA